MPPFSSVNRGKVRLVIFLFESQCFDIVRWVTATGRAVDAACKTLAPVIQRAFQNN